jgi:hypothetical protein
MPTKCSRQAAKNSRRSLIQIKGPVQKSKIFDGLAEANPAQRVSCCRSQVQKEVLIPIRSTRTPDSLVA